MADTTLEIQDLSVEDLSVSQPGLVEPGYWGETKVFSEPALIHRIFEARVGQAPTEGQVKFNDESVNFPHVNARANQLAHWFGARGIGPGDLVGVCLEPCVELVVCLLAVMKAGAGFVTFDLAHPQGRLDFVASDSGMKAVVFHDSTKAVCPTSPSMVLDLNVILKEASAYSTDNLDLEGNADDIIYVMYTSGSTGNPKGCILTHAGIRNRLLWGIEEYKLAPGAAVLFKTSISFDVSVWEIFAPLLSGADLVIAKQGATKEAAHIIGLINRHQVTHADFVPSMMSAFLGELSPGDCGSLRVVTCAGETLTAALLDRIFKALAIRVFNLYGPTETSLAVTYWSCTETPHDHVIPIGRPMVNVVLHVLDEEGRPVPEGEVGELYIGGVAVGRGYMNLPEKTAAGFVADPFGRVDRLYRTGDFVRIGADGADGADGAVIYVGRADQQVKLRGVRVELGEIEAQIAGSPLVREAVVLVRDFDADDQRLVAYVTLHAGPPADGDRSAIARQLRAGLQETLPIIMIPAHFVVLSTMPLTNNGKADRKYLGQLPVSRTQVSIQKVSTGDSLKDIEGRILEAWRNVLGVDDIGIEDDFFEFGGHSLLAAKIVTRLKSNYTFTVQELFQRRTVRALAELIAGRQ